MNWFDSQRVVGPAVIMKYTIFNGGMRKVCFFVNNFIHIAEPSLSSLAATHLNELKIVSIETYP